MYQVQSLNLGTTTLALQLAPWFADNAFPLMPHAGDVNENHHENCHHFEGRNRMIWISVFSFVLKMICSDLIPWDEHHHKKITILGLEIFTQILIIRKILVPLRYTQ